MDYIRYYFSSEEYQDITLSNEIKFYVHDEEQTVKASDFTPETSLNKYLRDTLHLKGTKVMCQEGGCGCCIVTATAKHPVTNKTVTFAVNSCLVSVFSCHGWKISTAEGIGNERTGYHKIQKTLTKFNGTQCGFCTPGMVMNMYELYQKEHLTMRDVENSFGGNICRCTGYRPILAAFKSLCSDADEEFIDQHPDIEDLTTCQNKSDCKRECTNICQAQSTPFYLDMGTSKWYKVFSVNDIINVFAKFPTASYMMIAGNTSKGVYRNTKHIELYLDVSNVKEILNYQISDDKLILGANMNLTDAMELFYKLGDNNKKFAYLTKLADHIDLIANVPVRNVGSLAGNLSIKHEHHEFPSDIYLIFETTGAKLTLVGADKKEQTINLVDYLTVDMKGKVLKYITLPALDESYRYESYKIMPRAQNAHALVNAGFLIKLEQDKVVSARIVYGGINPEFTHAKNTESYLIGKKLFDNNTLQEAFQKLNDELHPDYVLPDPTPDFRKKLAIALFYKFVLSITPDANISPRNKSGASKQVRPVSKGTQDYETNKALYPLTQPIPKIEAMAQVSGEAEYIIDMPDRPGQLFGAFVLAKAVPTSIIKTIDTSKAMKIKGVEGYFDKNDIPGTNSFIPKGWLYTQDEEIFCSGTVLYYFQPIGIIVATSQEIAEQAAELVEVSYTAPQRKPLLTIRDILKAGATDKIINEANFEPKQKGTDVKHVIKGSFDIGCQYHYHMETQCCNVIPTEDGLDVHPSSQGIEIIHTAIASALKIQANKINVKIRRLGGAYGAKISRNGIVSCAAALASHLLKKPVKLWMPFITNMNVIGKRYPCSADYEIAVNEKGAIQYFNTTVYSDYGMGGNEVAVFEFIKIVTGPYENSTFKIIGNSTRTDTPANTWCRAPGTTEGLAVLESVMEHVSYATGIDPIELRLANLNKTKHDKLAKFIEEFKDWAEIAQTKKDIEQFNKANRWVKKGISVVPMAYTFELFGNWNVFISIYRGDGSVAIAHGGVEMGQGINTKAAQVCAYAFEIPLEKVCVKPSNNLISPNAVSSGGSITSEAVCFGVLQAVKILKDRMKPIKEKMNNPTWTELIKKCFDENIDLSAMFLYRPDLPDVHGYMVYGVCSTEVEVDILTGNHQITKVNLLEDVGDSMSPEIDIGQVEGAYVMGQGYWTTEQIVFNDKGELLTNRTWTYKPPGAKDIPIDFRIKFPKNNPNPLGILKSKAIAEPPFCMTVSLPLAIRNAVASARLDANPKADKWYPFDGPSTVENTFLNSLHDYKQYVL